LTFHEKRSKTRGILSFKTSAIDAFDLSIGITVLLS